MKKSFTIVELLVVMAIIGLLTAFLLIGIPAVQRQSRNTTRQNDMRSVKTALEQYYGRIKAYPTFAMYTDGATFDINDSNYALTPVTMGNTYTKTSTAFTVNATCTVNNVYYALGTIAGTYVLRVCLEDSAGGGYGSDEYGNISSTSSSSSSQVGPPPADPVQ